MVLHLSTGEAVAVPRATVARCAALTHLPGNSVTLPPDAPVSACTLHLLLDLDALAMADAAEAHNAALGAVWSGGAEAAAAAASNARGAAAGRVAAAVQERLLLLDGWRTDELAALLVAADYLGATSLFGLLIDAVLAATEDMDSAALRAALHLPDDLLAPADVAAVRAALEELEPLPTELRDRWAASGAQPRAGGGMATLPDQVLCKLLGALHNHARFLAAGLTCSSWAAAAAEEARLSFEGARVNCGFLADVFAALPPGDATSAPACVLRHCRVLNSTRHGRDDDGERDRDGGPLSVDDVTLLLRGALALIAAGSLLSCEQLSFLALTPLALRCATKAGVHAEAVNTLAAEALNASTNSAARADAAMQAESAGGDAVALLRACVAVCAKHAAACAQAQLLLDAVANGAHSHTVWHAQCLHPLKPRCALLRRRPWLATRCWRRVRWLYSTQRSILSRGWAPRTCSCLRNRCRCCSRHALRSAAACWARRARCRCRPPRWRSSARCCTAPRRCTASCQRWRHRSV